MATHDYVIDNSTGANVRADLNLVLQAILSNNSSSSAPSTTAAYMWWADTTNGVLKIRNSANNAWVELLQLDGTLTLEDGSASTPALAFRDDLNTGIFSSAADRFNVATAGIERMELGTAGSIFNEDGADIDFRIEGDTDPNLFFIDASTDRVGIGTASPVARLEINGGNDAIARITGGATAARLDFATTNHHRFLQLLESGGGFRFYDQTNAAERLRIDSSGRVGIGCTPTAQFAHNILQIGNQATLGANAALSTTGQTYLTHNLYFDTGGTLKVFNTSNANEGAIIQLVDGIFKFSNSASTTGTPTVTERMRIDSSGNVGIGTSSPAVKLDVTGKIHTATSIGIRTTSPQNNLHVHQDDSGASVAQFTNSTTTIGSDGGFHVGLDSSEQGFFNLKENKPLLFEINGSERMRIDSSGRVGIGATSPSTPLHVSTTADGTTDLLTLHADSDGTNNGIASIKFTGNTGNHAAFIKGGHTTSGDSILTFHTDAHASGINPEERMRIDSSGMLSINATSGSIGAEKLFVKNGGASANVAGFFFNNTQDRSNVMIKHDRATGGQVGIMIDFIDQTNGSSGSIKSDGSSTSFETNSDYRLKENEVVISDGITRLKTLKPYRFNFKINPTKVVDGFFAHEVQSVVPEAISGEKDGMQPLTFYEDGDTIPSGKVVGDAKTFSETEIRAQSIDQSKLVPLLVAAVQELITKVETLEAA